MIEIPFARERAPARHDAERARRGQERRRDGAPARRAGARHALRARRARSTTTWAAASACTRAAGRPRGVLGDPEKNGHDGQRPDRRGRDLDGLLPPGRGAADLDGAGDRAAHRAHARDARRRPGARVTVVLLLVASVGLAAWGMRRPAARARAADRPDRRARRRPQRARVGPARPGDPDPRRALPPLLRAGPRRAPQAAGRLRRLAVGGAQRDRQRRRARRHQLQPRRPRLLEPGRGRRSSTARWRRSRPPTTRARASTCATTRPPTTRRSSRPTGRVHAAGGSTLDALTFMRAQGALLAIITVLALLALLRELLPDRPLLTGGVALICAFQPVFTWISGGVNPDGMLIALGAVLFWLFARAFRRGLDARTAVAIGLVLALAGLTKFSARRLPPRHRARRRAAAVAAHAAGGWVRPALGAALAGAASPCSSTRSSTGWCGGARSSPAGSPRRRAARRTRARGRAGRAGLELPHVPVAVRAPARSAR